MKRRILNTTIIAIMVIAMAGIVFAAEKTVTEYLSVDKKAGAPYTISFENDPMDDFTPVVSNPTADPPAVAVDPENKEVDLGGGAYDASGTLWYSGDSELGNCSNGVCDSCGGIRAIFKFHFNYVDSDRSGDFSQNSADGFVFIVASGQNYDSATNTYRSGGAPSNYSMGELVGYAGPGTTTDYLGILPPKMGIEFDTYPNYSADICSSGSRNDPNPFRNHIAQMFWGQRVITGNCTYVGTNYPKGSFDDNRHGVGGSGSDPLNASTGGYSQDPSVSGPNWCEDDLDHWFRIEITRATVPSGGTYNYTTRVWIQDYTFPGLNETQIANFKNVRANYINITNPSLISRTEAISAADHALMDRILFGWSEATGAATQEITISDFELAFNCGVTCIYTINPASVPDMARGGGTGSIAVTSPAGCPWTATSTTPSWLHVTSGATGTANGTVNYSVDPNAGSTRVGTIMIAYETFTVTQTGCEYVVDPLTDSYTPAGGTGSVSVSADADCSWTAVSNDGWITITSGSSGSGNGTVNYSVAANTGASRTGTMTVAGQTVIITQSSGCTYTVTSVQTSYGSVAGSDNYSVATGSGCPWTTSNNGNSWITVTPASATGGGSGTVSVSANTGPARSGTITIAGQDFTISQASGCTYTVTSVQTSYGISGGSDSYNISTGGSCPWTTSNNGNTWITVTPASATGGGSGTVSVSANTDPPRSGTITIAGQNFTISQSGCTYSVTSVQTSYGSGADSDNYSVDTSTGCPWTTSNNGNTWITVTPASDTGDGSGTVTVQSNSGPARSGTITIAGQDFTISQASGCSYTVTGIQGTEFAIGGGTDDYSVSTGSSCPWTTSNNGNSWITITPASATGSSSGTVTVDANPGAERSGTITIAGQNFTIDQDGGCAEYRVWNNTGNQYDFRVNGHSCRASINSGSEITTSSTRLQPGETVTRYTTAGSGCSSAPQGSITYTDAVNADTDGDCRINYNSGDAAGDR